MLATTVTMIGRRPTHMATAMNVAGDGGCRGDDDGDGDRSGATDSDSSGDVDNDIAAGVDSDG